MKYVFNICSSFFLLGCGMDCEKYINHVKSVEVVGIVTTFKVDGRFVSLETRQLVDGVVKEYDGLPSEIYINKDKIQVGDTILKKKNSLRWFIHGQNGVDTIYTNCGGKTY